MLKLSGSLRKSDGLCDHDLLLAYCAGYNAAVNSVYSALKADPGDLRVAVELVKDQFIDDPELVDDKSD